jgi:arsenite-transporting ATPase
LEKQRHIYEAALASLADAASTLVVIVSRAQSASLREAARAHGELDALGIRRQVLILNGLFQPASPGDAVADAFFARQEKALLRAVRFLSILPVHRVALRPHNLLGIETLRGLLGSTQSTPPPRVQPTSIGPIGEFSAPIPLLEKIASAGRGLILTMGKGGVGKTTIAAAVGGRHAPHLRSFPSRRTLLVVVNVVDRDRWRRHKGVRDVVARGVEEKGPRRCTHSSGSNPTRGGRWREEEQRDGGGITWQ